jgi:hypothetical protein
MDAMILPAMIFGMPLDTEVSVDSMLALIENEGLFLSPRGVCSGPPHMVEELLCAVIEGTDASDRTVIDQVGDLDRFYRAFAQDARDHLAHLVAVARGQDAVPERLAAFFAALDPGALQIFQGRLEQERACW